MRFFDRLIKIAPLGIFVSAAFSVNVAGAQSGVINTDGAGIRVAPSADALTLGTAEQGKAVTILSRHGDFYMVSMGSFTDVYIYGAFITPDGATQGIVNAPSINIRAAGSADADIVGTAGEGEAFTILANIDGWYRVTYGSQYGYIFSDFLAVSMSRAREAYTEPVSNNDSDTDFTMLLASIWDVADDEQAEESVESEVLGDTEESELVVATADVLPSGDIPSFANFNLNFDNLDIDAAEAFGRTFVPQAGVYAVVNSPTGLNLRINASTDADVVTILYPMQTLNVYDILTDWARISTLDGNHAGYVNVEFIAVRSGERSVPPEPDSERARKII
ncbi:MAG: SH3 domain-containing protein, partial [Defluviitaleaceae bacterium]|nr:SH3 domain-containing protein [Defluviitaleaceae bacterium]